MKKIFVLVLILVFVLCGCSGTVSQLDKDMYDFHDSLDENDNNPGIVGDADDDIMLFSWFSYPEIKPYPLNQSKEEYRNKVSSVMGNLSKLGVSDVFVQVRPFADAIYPSKLFPSSSCVVESQGDALPFDFLELIIQEAEKKNLRVHGWINPYRIQSAFDENKLFSESVYYKWFSQGESDIKKAAGGLYFSPSSVKVQELIIEGVRELMENYKLSGIHIDDYFYPTTEESFDKEEYSKYRQDGGKLSLGDWRRANVSSLLSGIYCAVKSFGEEKIFSVSPSGDIEKNMNELYADVKLWCKEEGYCDLIIPQIYFGFENSKLPFEKCALSWKQLMGEKTKLGAGLALYKAGLEDVYAGEGKNEWINNSDIIKRQYVFLSENGFDAVGIYSASFIKFNENSQGKETQNLSDVLLYKNK